MYSHILKVERQERGWVGVAFVECQSEKTTGTGNVLVTMACDV